MNTNLKILFKLTTRSRPEKAFKTINSVLDNIVSNNYHFLISCDADDLSMNNDEVKQELNSLISRSNLKFTYVYGESKNKIDAINRDLNFIPQDWDILVNVSDDQLFIRKGFDDIIREAFINQNLMHPDLDLFVHFPDGNQKKLATMSIMGKTYYNRDKYIYHPDYKSLFCDNEAQEVAIKRGCYKFMDEDIFVHNHPAWGKAQTDPQYQHTESFWGADERTYNRRKAKDFEL